MTQSHNTTQKTKESAEFFRGRVTNGLFQRSYNQDHSKGMITMGPIYTLYNEHDKPVAQTTDEAAVSEAVGLLKISHIRVSGDLSYLLKEWQNLHVYTFKLFDNNRVEITKREDAVLKKDKILQLLNCDYEGESVDPNPDVSHYFVDVVAHDEKEAEIAARRKNEHYLNRHYPKSFCFGLNT